MGGKMRIKRAFDITFSLIGIIILSPLILITAILVYIKLGRPIFFVQPRVGKNNKVFKMIKFRTMLNLSDKQGNPLKDEERLPPFGRAIRSLSLDELPELFNVLKGDMSIVGPRPLLEEYLSLYNERQRKRHDVLPGITGWAQVNGRNSIGWSEKLEFDVWYVENSSILLDFKIMLMTILKVFTREGVNQAGNATVEKFNGAN
jgi:lipopolysaccharide/colanic/teichoic acid biosynthesis glycosyltransferase